MASIGLDLPVLVQTLWMLGTEMSLSASKRMEIWLHKIKGSLEYEQGLRIFSAISGGGAEAALTLTQSQAVDWGPRMREALEKDVDTVIDWLCEIGALVPTGATTFERSSSS